jgi:putative transposase
MLATAGGRCLSLRRTSCCDCGDDYYACILLDQLTGERRKAVRLIVPVAAGGPTDIVARMLAEKLSKMWGQQVFIENKGGAGTNIGNEYVAQSFANTPAALYQFAECLTLHGFPNHSQNDSTWQTEGFAMGQAIAVRMDYTSDEVRQLAKRAKDASQARRLLAIAVVLDGASREEAAKAGGMERQTLRDWVIRFNEKGPDGLVNKSSPGAPSKLTEEHKAFLVRLVEEGPIPAVDGVVRWRACDLIMRLYEEFGISVSDDTIYRALKTLGFSHVSARPKAYRQNAEAMDAFKKTSPSVWRKSARSSHPTHR